MTDERIDIELTDSVSPAIQTKIEGIAAAADKAFTNLQKLQAQLLATGAGSADQLTTALAAQTSAQSALAKATADLAKQQEVNVTAGAKLTQTIQAQGAAATQFVGKLKATESALGRVSHGTSGVTRELVTLGREASRGDISRLIGSSTLLAQYLGLLEKLMQPVVLLVIAAVAAFTALAIGINSAQSQIAQFNNTLQATGNYAGLTVDSFNNMTKAIAANTDQSVSSVKAIAGVFVATGQYTALQVQQLTSATIKLSQLTGQSADAIAKDFAKMGEAPAQWADTFNKQYHALSIAQLAHIDDLEREGDATGATAVLAKNLFDYYGNQAPQKLGALSRAWHDVATWASNAWHAMTAPSTLDEQIDALQQKLQQLRTVGGGRGGSQTLTDTQATAKYQVTTNRGSSNEFTTVQNQLQVLQARKTATDALTASQAAASQEQLKDQQALERTNSEWLNYSKNIVTAAQKIKQFRADLARDQASNPNSDSTKNLTQNQAQIEAAINKKYNPQGTKDADFLAKTNEQLDNEVKLLGLVGDAREVQQKLDAIELSALEKHVVLSATDKATLQGRITAIVDYSHVQAEANSIYQQAIGPQQTFNAAQQAGTELLDSGKISLDQYNRALNLATLQYAQATQPLLEYNRNIQQSEDLLGKYGQQLSVATELQQLENQLRTQGKELLGQELQNETALFNQKYKAEQLNSSLLQIYNETSGAIEKNTFDIAAASLAYSNGLISLEAYQSKLNALQTSAANIRLNAGKGSFTDAVNAAVGQMVNGYTTALAGLSQSFGTFFESIETGFADSIGHSIVYADNLKTALNDVAKQALSALLGALIKIGVQAAINAVISDTSLSSATTASAIAAAATATAWAPAATLVNTATFGAAAIAGDATLLASAGVAEGIAAASSVGGLMSAQSGGYTGDGPVNQIAGYFHGKEYVVNAQGTAANRPVLEAMNSGAKFVQQNAGHANSAGVSAQPINIHVENYGSSKISAQQLSATDVRIIARDEATTAVRTQAPNVIAGRIANPNSEVSKSINKNVQAPRKRS